jgi:Uma2 family endonuclease
VTDFRTLISDSTERSSVRTTVVESTLGDGRAASGNSIGRVQFAVDERDWPRRHAVLPNEHCRTVKECWIFGLTLDLADSDPEICPVMNTIVLYDDTVDIPSGISDLTAFRRWAHSDAFPESGRICFLDGRVWLDMSKEQIFTHNQIKQEFNLGIGGLVKAQRLGRFFPDGLLLTNDRAQLACQPDGTFVSRQSLKSGRVRLIEGEKEGYLELEGTPDMVLEVVSASSVEKDNETLPDLYWRAGIPEYWLVDAREDRLEFDIFRFESDGYKAVRKQAGWLKSRVFGRSFRLSRQLDDAGNPEFSLSVR